MGRYFSKKALKRRLKEPSSLAGFAVLAGVLAEALGVPPGVAETIIIAAGAGAVVVPEQGPASE